MNPIGNYRWAIGVAVALFANSLAAQDDYEPHPDTLEKEGVPKGEVLGPFEWVSEIFPGTVREYHVYVPAQYDPETPACVTIVQDGLGRARGWGLMNAMDNLIHSGEIPVQIGIFITPGVVPAPREGAQPRFNRSFEYDALGDRYARFLIEEILPEVGNTYNLSVDPNDRLIAGASSGAICAFNAAWERPDAFRRVFSTIGTYVGLRGGDEFPTLVRKSEPKPIRVFLQDGTTDLNLYAGSWWTANLSMLSALEWAGYEVAHAWGTGGHNGKHGRAVLPDALRFLWKDYPKPVESGLGKGAPRRTNVLIPGEDWELVSEGHGFTEGPAVSPSGDVYFSDIPNGEIWRIGLDGKASLFADDCPGVNGLMFGADGRLYACENGNQRIVSFDADGHRETVIEGLNSNDIVALPEYGYVTDPNNRKVWLAYPDGRKTVVDEGISFPNGAVTSPDLTLLYVTDMRGQFVYSFQIQDDGALKYKQPFFHLHLPPGGTESGADGMTVDTEGRLYVATHLGVQVCDQPGRVQLIMEKPQRKWLANVVFGGAELNYLYATSADKVYRRKLNAKGVVPSRGAVEPPRPRL